MNSKKPHLAYISGNPIFTVDSPSGYSTRIRELCLGFEASGIRTSVHVPGLLQTLVEKTQTRGRMKAKSLIPTPLWQAMKDAYRWHLDNTYAKRLLTDFPDGLPDVVYECLEYSGSVTERLRKTHPALFVLEIHGPLQEDAKLTSGRRPLQFLLNLRLRRAIRQADFIVVVSTVIQEWLLEKYAFLKAEKIIVLPNGANLDTFRPSARPAPSKHLVVGFVGSDLAWHRLDALIEAFASLPKDMRIRLHIVGLANENILLKAIVKKNRLEDKVVFLGPVAFDQVPKTIDTFDIAVMPGSNRYGSPIKLFEYAAMGKAVIAPNEPPVKEIFEHKKDLLLVPSGDVAALKAAIQTLASDHELRSRLAESMQKKVREQYGWNRIAEKIAQRIGMIPR